MLQFNIFLYDCSSCLGHIDLKQGKSNNSNESCGYDKLYCIRLQKGRNMCKDIP